MNLSEFFRKRGEGSMTDPQAARKPALRRNLCLAAIGLTFVSVTGAAILTGCGAGGGTNTASSASLTKSKTGKATLTITWPAVTATTKLIPVASNSIVAAFSQNGAVISTQTVARPTTGNTTTITFSPLPTGTLIATATAYPNADGSGTAQATASASTTIVADTVTPLTITMGSTIDHLAIAPTAPTVTAGSTTSLTETAYDSSGNIVLTSTSIAWTSSAAGIATVNSSGVVTGVAAGTATITATDSESGKTVNVTVTVTAASTPTPSPSPSATACSALTGEAAVVCYANDLYSNQSLTTTQQAALEIPFTQAHAVYWNNLPVGNARNGVPVGTLTTAQQADFIAIVKAALNSSDAAGYLTYDEIREADDYLSANQGSGSTGPGGTTNYSSAIYYMAFLGSPSNSSAWELQLTGHHNVLNIVYNGSGGVITATPNFFGVEPNDVNQTATPVKIPTGETAETASIIPMQTRRNAMEAIFTTLQTTDSTQYSAAKLSESFNDVLYGPNTDAAFVANTKKEGVAIGSLSASDQAAIIPLVTSAINTWVNTLPESQASVLRNLYESTSAMQSTYIGYSLPSGTTSPVPTSQGVYYRIDGPNCWIEFVCQNGVVISSQIHYHSVWRDHKLDYGAQISGLHQ